MQPDDSFSEWAALFLAKYGEDGAAPPPDTGPALPGVAADVQSVGLTSAAAELLRAVDAGGVPAFVTGSLKQIARENGIEVTATSTPNEIVAALRVKAGYAGASSSSSDAP